MIDTGWHRHPRVEESTMERWRDFVWTAIAAASAVTAGSAFYVAVSLTHMGGHCR